MTISPEIQEMNRYLMRIQDIFDDLYSLNIIQKRKVTIGKEPQIKVVLNKGMRDTYGWEIEILSDSLEYSNLLTILKEVNGQMKEMFK